MVRSISLEFLTTYDISCKKDTFGAQIVVLKGLSFIVRAKLGLGVKYEVRRISNS